MNLKAAWNRIRFELESHDIGDPSTKVVKELEKEGWSFKLRDDFAAATPYGPVSYTYLLPISPDGKPAYGGEHKETYLQYRDARRQAAQKVYGIE